VKAIKLLDMPTIQCPCLTTVQQNGEHDCMVYLNFVVYTNSMVIPQALSESAEGRSSLGQMSCNFIVEGPGSRDKVAERVS